MARSLEAMRPPLDRQASRALCWLPRFGSAINDGSCLTVLAASSCDVGVVAYEMTVLVTRTGDVLTPRLRAELQAALPP